MARLPIPGKDDNIWGNVLNDFLAQAHASDGQIKNSSISSAQLDTPTRSSVTRAATSLQTTNNLADVADAATARTNLDVAAASHTHVAGDLTIGATTNTALDGILAGDGSSISVATSSQIGASSIPDAGNYFTTDTIDGALQEVGSQLADIMTGLDFPSYITD
ncbi:MAG TPA: hypothetical protein VF809_00740, partial [Candidatus Saccharimonadales bacterium]